MACAEVSSANIVGYQGSDLAVRNYNMIAVPFEAVDGTGWKLNEALAGVNLSANADSDLADQIQFWQPDIEDYEYFFYRDNKGKISWNSIDNARKTFEDLHPEGALPGTAFWFLSATEEETSSATFSGQVNNSKSFTKDDMMSGQYNMFGSPFPIPLKLNTVDDVTLFRAEGAAANADSDLADQIQIWQPDIEDYEYFFYRDNKGKISWNSIDNARKTFEDLHPDGLETDKGFWYLSNGEEDLTVTFFNPIATQE